MKEVCEEGCGTHTMAHGPVVDGSDLPFLLVVERTAAIARSTACVVKAVAFVYLSTKRKLVIRGHHQAIITGLRATLPPSSSLWDTLWHGRGTHTLR